MENSVLNLTKWVWISCETVCTHKCSSFISKLLYRHVRTNPRQLGYSHSKKILICSNTIKEYWSDVAGIPKALSRDRIHLQRKKCESYNQVINYLGLINCSSGVLMDLIKVCVLKQSVILRYVFDLHSFLTFANIYWPFISSFSEIVQYLTAWADKWERFESDY